MKKGIIGGTGCLKLFEGERQAVEVTTPYGQIPLYEINDTLVFLLRHGANHNIPPHKINYRANIWALKEVGVEALFGIYAVGSITETLQVGEAALVDQFIDFCGGQRISTFFDEEVTHTPLSTPYSARLNHALIEQAQQLNFPLAQKGVYVCTNGPRLESAAEIEMFRRWGGDYVGMTASSETILANELSLEFSAIAYSINWATGVKEELSFLPQAQREKLLEKIVHLIVVADTLPKGIIER
ncbi:MAG: S-methyl-5'-thioadenosine phosphorylase [Sphaerochaetaceae bacterium]